MTQKRAKRICFGFLLLLALVLALSMGNLIVGSTRVGAGEALRALFSGDRSGAAGRIVWDIRLPRLLAAAVLL